MRVREVIATMFAQLVEVRSARQILPWLRQEPIEKADRHSDPLVIVWTPRVAGHCLRCSAWSKARPLEPSPRPLSLCRPSHVMVEPSVQRVC